MEFLKLQYHIENECKYTLINCKYKSLGCNWNGFKKNLINHQNKCTIDQDNILNIVNELKLKLHYIKMADKMESIYFNCNQFIVNAEEESMESIVQTYDNPFKFINNLEWRFVIKIKYYNEWYQMYIRLECVSITDIDSDINIDIAVMYDKQFNDEQIILKNLQFRDKITRNKTNSKWIQFEPYHISEYQMQIIKSNDNIKFKVFLHLI